MERNPNSCHRQLLATGHRLLQSVTHTALFARLPTRGSYSLPLRPVQVSEWICVIALGVACEPSPLGAPHRPLDFHRGPLRFWPRPGLRPSSLHPPLPPRWLTWGRQKRKRTSIKRKKKKNWKRIQQQLGETGREPASISGLLCADTSLPGLWPLVFRPPSQLLVAFPEQL